MPFTHAGDLSPHMRERSAGGESVNGGDIDLMGGGILSYTKSTVTLQCNFSATVLLKLVDSYLIASKFAQKRSINTKELGHISHHAIVALLMLT